MELSNTRYHWWYQPSINHTQSRMKLASNIHKSSTQPIQCMARWILRINMYANNGTTPGAGWWCLVIVQHQKVKSYYDVFVPRSWTWSVRVNVCTSLVSQLQSRIPKNKAGHEVLAGDWFHLLVLLSACLDVMYAQHRYRDFKFSMHLNSEEAQSSLYLILHPKGCSCTHLIRSATKVGTDNPGSVAPFFPDTIQ